MTEQERTERILELLAIVNDPDVPADERLAASLGLANV